MLRSTSNSVSRSRVRPCTASADAAKSAATIASVSSCCASGTASKQAHSTPSWRPPQAMGTASTASAPDHGGASPAPASARSTARACAATSSAAVPLRRVDGQDPLPEDDGRRTGAGRLPHPRGGGADRRLQIGRRGEALGDALERAEHRVAVAQLAVQALQLDLRLLALEQGLGDAVQDDEGHHRAQDRVEQQLHPEARRLGRRGHHDQLVEQHHADDQRGQPDPGEAHLGVEGRGDRRQALEGPGHHPVHRSRASGGTRR